MEYVHYGNLTKKRCARLSVVIIAFNDCSDMIITYTMMAVEKNSMRVFHKNIAVNWEVSKRNTNRIFFMSVQLRPFNKIYKLRELATYLSEVRIVKVNNVM